MITPEEICNCLSYLLNIEIIYEKDDGYKSTVWKFFSKKIGEHNALRLDVLNIKEENLKSVLECAIWLMKYEATVWYWKNYDT